MVGNGLDVAASAQVNPTRPLDLHCNQFELFFEIFPCFEIFFNQRKYCTTGFVGTFRSTKLGEKLIV